jgi:hypothetical protein
MSLAGGPHTLEEEGKLLRPPGVEDDTPGADITRPPSNEANITAVITPVDPECLLTYSYPQRFKSPPGLIFQVVTIELSFISPIVDGSVSRTKPGRCVECGDTGVLLMLDPTW